MRRHQLFSVSVGLLTGLSAPSVAHAQFFESTWQTATGTSEQAVTDGGAWDRWETNSPDMLAVGSLTDPGAAAELAGLNMVTASLGDDTGWVMVTKDDVGTDSVDDFYWRMYLRVHDTDNVYGMLHPFQDFESEGAASMNFYIGIAGVTPEGRWSPYLASYAEQPEIGTGTFSILEEFTPELMLHTGRWYRLEGHIAYLSREGEATRTTYDIHIFDPEVSQTEPVVTSDDFRAGSCTGPCYGSTLKSFYDQDQRLYFRSTSTTFTIGNNGPFGGVGTEPLYDVTALALSHDGWIGPYGTVPSGAGGRGAGGNGSGAGGATSGAGGAGPGSTGATNPADGGSAEEGGGCAVVGMKGRGSTPRWWLAALGLALVGRRRP